ncbi:MAG: hypothetical protein ACODAG_06105 [Myxococcota bacterium]
MVRAIRGILVAVALLVLVGCQGLPNTDAIEASMAEVAASADLVLTQFEVHDVRCSVDSLSIADRLTERGVCGPFNARMTKISVHDYPISVGGMWSSNPAAVSVTTDGHIRAETEVDTVWIYAEGTRGTVDSVQVWSY